MAFSQADLDAIDRAIASGAQRVRYPDGSEIQYRTMDEMERARARHALALLRDYEAAKTPRKWAGWRRPATGARTEIAAGAGKVRDSVRDLIRNNGYAARAHRTLVRATVGTGIVGTPPAAARDAWDRWVDHCDLDGHHDLYGLQLLATRTVYESGGALVRYYRQDFARGDTIAPVRIRVLEEDFIDTAKSGDLNGGGWIDRGVEYDARGVKVALWLHAHHPGDVSRWSRQRDSERVPLGEVEHVYDKLRPGQDRGVSIFAGAVMPLRDLADYFEAEGMRKRIESCLSVFVTSGDDGGPMLGIDPERDGDTGAPSTRLAPGMIHRMGAGESVTTLAPNGSPDITPYADQLLFLAAAAGGVMFEHMTGNMKHVNYSSYRVGSFDFAGAIEQMQWLTFLPRMCIPMGARFAEAARAARMIGEDFSVRWTPPAAVTSPDPLKDAKADELNLRLGALAPSEIAERRGWTYQELLERIRADLASADAIGVQFDGDPRKNVKGQANATDADGRADA